MPFAAASHHDVLALLVQVTVLLLAARALAEVAQRLGQPSVLGEILAGILLGPSVLSTLAPAVGEWIVPQTPVQGHLLEVVALIGAMFLLLVAGLETDLTLIRRHARTAIGVSYGGIIVTFGTGLLLGLYLPDYLLADPERRLVFALFVATAMSISAIPVIAKVLLDLNLMRRDIGQTIIAAGMNDDTNGWILLSVVAALAAGETVTVGRVLLTVGSVLGFLVLSFYAGRSLVRHLLDFVQDRVVIPHKTLTLVVALVFAWSALSLALSLEAVLGAFVMGILLGQLPRLPIPLRESVGGIAFGVFTPVFFAVAGLKVNLTRLADPELLGLAGLVVLVATVGKVVGTYAGARLIGRRDHWTALSFGVALNARGAMEIIIATIGLNLGILSQDMFSIVVLMAMATSFLAPPGLRWVLRHVQPEEQELRRLREEELAQGSIIANIRRVLLPLRLRPGDDAGAQAIEAAILERLSARSRLSLTLLNVSPPGNRAAGAAFLDRADDRFRARVQVRKVVEATDAGNAIIDEARKDYQLLLLGAPERTTGTDTLFTPLVDYVIRMSPCPTLVVRGQRRRRDWAPRRILVPTNGSVAARHAAELAFALATAPDDVVHVLNVAVVHASEEPLDAAGNVLERQLAIGEQFVRELRELGEARGVHTRTGVRAGPDPESAILDLAAKEGVDLIVVGTNVRVGSSRLFLGPRVERILNNAPCPVIVLNV
jgi:Kef-type K+ transport system membrane component KefB